MISLKNYILIGPYFSDFLTLSQYFLRILGSKLWLSWVNSTWGVWVCGWGTKSLPEHIFKTLGCSQLPIPSYQKYHMVLIIIFAFSKMIIRIPWFWFVCSTFFSCLLSLRNETFLFRLIGCGSSPFFFLDLHAIIKE